MQPLHNVRFGLILALATLLYGFGLGGYFGAFEHEIKDSLKSDATAVFDTVYKGDSAAMKKITDKSWVYIKRAHMHANGIGAASVGVICILAALNIHWLVSQAIALMVGAGGLFYAMCWQIAGVRAPGLGSTGLAKETIAWLAKPSAALCIMGIAAVLCCAIFALLIKPKCTCSEK